MALVAGVRCSFAGEDAGSVHIRRYGRDRGRCRRASSVRRRHRRCFAEPSYTPANSRTWVSRMWLPDGSRNDESIPYGCSCGSSTKSTPRALSSS